MTPAFSLCVYCGSRTGTEPRFAALAVEVGQWIGQHGGQLVYGGGNNGLMGVLEYQPNDQFHTTFDGYWSNFHD